MGTIFGSGGKHGQRAYDAWRRAVAPKWALSGEALEVAVMHLAQSNPEYVQYGVVGR